MTRVKAFHRGDIINVLCIGVDIISLSFVQKRWFKIFCANDIFSKKELHETLEGKSHSDERDVLVIRRNTLLTSY